jgi:hypothetical protein
MITSNAQLDFIAGWSNSDEVSRKDLSFAFSLRTVAGSAWWASEIWGLSTGAISQLYAPKTLMSNELITERGRKWLPIRLNPNMQRNKMLFPASYLSDAGFLYGMIPWSENNGRFGGVFFP